MDPDDVLAGPRGRRTCWGLAGEGWIRPGVTAPPAPMTVSPVDEQWALDALMRAAASARYWQPPDETDVELATPAWQPFLRSAAEALASTPALAWWESPIALDDQQLVVFDSADNDPLAVPALTGRGSALAAMTSRLADLTPGTDPSGALRDWRTVSGCWWSAPITAPPMHSERARGPDRIPAGLLVVEDRMGWTAVTSWPVGPIGIARVCELQRPADWVALVRKYPLEVSHTTKRGDWWRTTGRDGAWLMPNWSRVAEDWDAVHLSVAGYLSTAGRALTVDDRAATVLAGWGPDATFWLADVLEFAGAPTRWRAEHGAEWGRC